MQKYWDRINYLTRHQVYLRVLPVVFISVSVLGTLSWVLFEHKTLTAASSHQEQELIQLATGLRFQLTRLAMSAELRKSEICKEHFASKTPAAPCSKIIGQGIIKLDQVSATCQLTETSDALPCVVLNPRFNTGANVKNLEHWVRNQGLLGGHQRLHDELGRFGNPTILESDPWHEILIFPSVFLDHASTGTEPASWASSQAQLPLLVRHLSNHKNEANGETLTLLMVDLGRLLAEMPTPEWLCFVDDDGEILWEQGRTRTDSFAGVSGQELLNMSIELPKTGFQAGLVNRWTDPWLVATVSSPELPITLVSARSANDLLILNMRYLLFVFGMTTLALFGAILGVMRVMNRVTLRMDELAESMSELAKGEYSRRMPEGRWDEIGQLVGYFNLMAISLDEAHREVKEKTVHLRAALENMRLLDKAKDDFLVLISHEVRTPLTSIMGGVDFLKSSLARVSGEEEEILKQLNVPEIVSIIQNSGQRLSGFMTDAIQMTSLQSSDHKLELKFNPIPELVEMGLCGIRAKASTRNIMVENQLDEQVWSVLGDAKILKMALEKIFDNALVHNRDGGKIIIRESWDVPGQGSSQDLLEVDGLQALMEQPGFNEFEDEDIRWRLIEVFNSGDPIPLDRQKALFGKFELVGRIENHHKGSGLSLPIALGAVKCHGGRILLHSDQKDGNSFYLLLPTILDDTSLGTAMAASLWHDAHESIGSITGDKQVSQVADFTAFKVEVDDLSTTIDSSVNQTGGGVNGSGSSDNQKEVTISSRSK